jgi:hypothetical protein
VHIFEPNKGTKGPENWIEYFPYKYSFKIISNDECHKSAVANAKWFFET